MDSDASSPDSPPAPSNVVYFPRPSESDAPISSSALSTTSASEPASSSKSSKSSGPFHLPLSKPVLALLALVAIVLIIVAAMFLFPSALPPRDCGSDFSCFHQSMLQGCPSARFYAYENHVNASFTLTGKNAVNASLCDFRVQVVDYSRPDGMDNNTWKAVDALHPVATSLSMTCQLDPATAQALYDRQQLTTAQSVFQTCSGSLKDVISRLAGNTTGAGSR